MKLTLIAILAMILTIHLAHGENRYGENRHERRLCKEIEQKRYICQQLRLRAERGGDKAAIFASESEKACSSAEKLIQTRLDYIKRKQLSSPEECHSQEGYRAAVYLADKIIKNIDSGSLKGKMYNLLVV